VPPVTDGDGGTTKIGRIELNQCRKRDSRIGVLNDLWCYGAF